MVASFARNVTVQVLNTALPDRGESTATCAGKLGLDCSIVRHTFDEPRLLVTPTTAQKVRFRKITTQCSRPSDPLQVSNRSGGWIIASGLATVA